MKFLVPRSWFLVPLRRGLVGSLSLVLAYSFVFDLSAANEEQSTKNQEQKEFRPEMGKFPPADQARDYSGQLVFVDHANRRGSLRVVTQDAFFRNPPHPFAMLPYGMVRYRGAPADLRDIPLGTMLHGKFYLPPDPKTSLVPVVNDDRPDQPAQNYAILLEDEPSRCLREGLVWKMKEIEIREDRGVIVATCEPKEGGSNAEPQRLLFDAATRIWRGRELLRLADLVAEGTWPANGKKPLADQAVLLGLTWKPARDWAATPFYQRHISDVWLDDASMQRATGHQIEAHKELIRSRWMPAWVDAIDYGKFGEATVTATLFGGMDPSLYADFKKGGEGQIASTSASTLKPVGAAESIAHMAIRGPILDVTKADGNIPWGSSGIQIKVKVGLVLEGYRPGNVVRIRPRNWPGDAIPREEFVGDDSSYDERYPSSDIFPKY